MEAYELNYFMDMECREGGPDHPPPARAALRESVSQACLLFRFQYLPTYTFFWTLPGYPLRAMPDVQNVENVTEALGLVFCQQCDDTFTWWLRQ